MRTKLIQNAESTRSDILATEIQHLFNDAVSTRMMYGITPSLRLGYIREIAGCDDEAPFIQVLQKSKEECGCGCSEGESCDLCDKPLEDVCSIEDTMTECNRQSPFRGIATLLTTVKKYEFISLVENAYAQIGNKPFKLKANKEPQLEGDELTKSSKAFFGFVDNFLTTNQVRVNEIAEAFSLETLGEVTKALSVSAQNDAEIRLQQSLASNEGVMERVFKRAQYMPQYMEVIKDTTDYPIGIMWVDDKSMKKQRVIRNGKLIYEHVIQCDANRIDPCYFWATEDHKLNQVGRAVFKLEQFTSGDLHRWKGVVSGSTQLDTNITEYLELHEDGYRAHDAMLFDDHMQLKRGLYDVLVGRGQFEVEGIKQLNVDIPDEYKHEKYVPCEVYFSAGEILRARVMQNIDERLGVYTTVFRRRGQSIFGYSLHDFLYPFAKLYQGTVEAIDKSVGKSVGSIIQIDTGVIEDVGKYLKKNEKTGEVTLDLADDIIVEFNSTEAFTSPNFKGVPITIDQLPSDLNKLLPVVDFIFAQLEKISGIPSILVNASNVSSALRTNSNFNAAFAASAKVVQSLLRESERRILEPSIRFFFDSKAASGEMKDFLIEAEPEILMSDTLTREMNDDQDKLQSLQTLTQFSSLIPQERLAGLINAVGREVYNLDVDLVPGVGPLSTTTPSTNTQGV